MSLSLQKLYPHPSPISCLCAKLVTCGLLMSGVFSSVVVQLMVEVIHNIWSASPFLHLILLA